jgi:hypothetical protein
MSQQIDIVFKEELRGRNALHFWLGFATVCFGLYFYFSQFFSAFAIDANIAPKILKSSFEARNTTGLSSTGAAGFGNTGTVSLLFDTVCLIGWGTAAVLLFMRKAIVAIAERFGFMSNGLLAWANQQQTKNAGPANDELKTLEGKVAKAVRNHEERLVLVEAKTIDLPLPPPPKSLEEIVAEQARVIEQLKKQNKPQPNKGQGGATNA